MNYTHCIVTEEQANAGADMQVVDSLFTDVDITNGKVNYQDAIIAYLDFSDQMQNILDSYDYEIKFYNLADVEQSENGFKLYYVLYYKQPQTKSTAGKLWDITSDWYWGYEIIPYPRAGKCDGTYQGQDAVTEITRWLSINRSVPYNVYYTDVHWLIYHYDSNQDDYNNLGIDLSQFGVDMFWEYEWGVIPTNQLMTYFCITATDCNYYANETKDALIAIENNKEYCFLDEDESIANYEFRAGTHTVTDQNGNQIGKHFEHFLKIKAGVPHQYIID